MEARNRRYIDSVTEQVKELVVCLCKSDRGGDARFLLDTASLIDPDFDIDHWTSKL